MLPRYRTQNRLQEPFGKRRKIYQCDSLYKLRMLKAIKLPIPLNHDIRTVILKYSGIVDHLPATW